MNRCSTVSRWAARIVAHGVACIAAMGVCRQAVAQGQKVVYMVIKAPATETVAEIRDKFELAKRSTGGTFNCDGVIIEPVEAETFGLLNEIVTRGADAIRDAKRPDKKNAIERLPGERDAWSVDLGGTSLIESATIVVAAGDGTTEESLDVTVGESHPQGLDVSFHSPGRYIVRTPAGVRPLRFRCEADEVGGDGGVAKREVAADFPPVDSGLTYLVTLNGVRGESKHLFTALRDKEIVPNPLQQMGDVPLIVANFVPNKPDIGIVGGQISLRFAVPQGENPKRLWLFLAPTKAARDVELARLTAGKGGDDSYFTKIPERIRTKTSKRILPGADGGWVELSPPENGWFQGSVEVDVPQWQAAIRAGGADVNDALLMVYEGEYGEARERRPIRVSGNYVVTEPYPQWLPAIRAAK